MSTKLVKKLPPTQTQPIKQKTLEQIQRLLEQIGKTLDKMENSCRDLDQAIDRWKGEGGK